MRHTVYKLLWGWEYDKEEKWLNEMAAQGKALVSVGFCNTFLRIRSRESIRLKLNSLTTWPPPLEAILYPFSGGNWGGTYRVHFRWIYVRKKASNGALDLYSDIGSKIRYMKRLQTFFISLTIFELFIGIMTSPSAFCPTIR
jgi:hypothetical protein